MLALVSVLAIFATLMTSPTLSAARYMLMETKNQRTNLKILNVIMSRYF